MGRALTLIMMGCFGRNLLPALLLVTSEAYVQRRVVLIFVSLLVNLAESALLIERLRLLGL
jgi:hypothetical protein